MFAERHLTLVIALLFIAGASMGDGQAAEVLQPPGIPRTAAASAQIGRAPAALKVPAPQPVGEDGAAAADALAADGSYNSGLLRDISQRQTELAILELDVKRAELQKRLKELEGGPLPGPATVAVSPPVMPPSAPPLAPPSAVAEPRPEPHGGVTVRRIHKIGGELTALITYPGGETRNVRRGASLAPGLTVVDIGLDAVQVREGDRPPFALPIGIPSGGGP